MQSQSSSPAARIEKLVKTFGATRALDGIDLEIPVGHALGLLGPNGAGKTTTVRILTTLLRPDSGRAWVAGHDVLAEPDAVRRSIGLSGQYAAVDENLSGYENLYLVARFHGLSRAQASRRSRELLAGFRLEDAAERLAKTYSGGMRRRLDLAGALVARPPVVVLDEPTTGLDPRSRLETWDVIGELVADGASVLLTTQYLEEADRLANTIAVIDRGRVIARGTSDDLKARIGGERLELVVAEHHALSVARQVFAEVGSAEPRVNEQARQVSVPVDNGPKALVEVMNRLDGVRVLDVGLRRPSLDEVFLSLTGHTVEGE
ncbi:daunorubicin resistance protein DrrA family ABC transporter ATP-binding protein [Kibdelosporangium aridum]|uniref:Daunorubicin resistance protein DrrA family ABC transporter ATP-binding protein n=1 Tax=Kibdelosporangium aridum TaxID=2030 RepID=A0A428YBZ5_KIBAR|nr:daunorubicin resistance protein DrrA family ABC transporter ATP-binding protein [Kibdelosporangium aridum]RSM65094.1 daunorubicin resistance protein DrrA family ABC transporter ATP-binding protein [Kibdelosporangium aridum]